MSDSSSSRTFCTGLSASVQILRSCAEAEAFLPGYKAGFSKLGVGDQEYPEHLVIYIPSATPDWMLGEALLLVGGMGPLAGAQAFEEALGLFGDSRPIVLAQVCGIPDRTATIVADMGASTGSSPQHSQVVEHLGDGIAEAVGLAAPFLPENCSYQVIWTCNTAHYFLPDVMSYLEDESPAVFALLTPLSLIEAGTAKIDLIHGGSPALLMYTRGTRMAGLYRQLLMDSGCPFVEPDEEAQDLLTSAIYKGVKIGNKEEAVRFSLAFFHALPPAVLSTVSVVLAGCTEIPEILSLLSTYASDDAVVSSLLRGAQVVSPVTEALHKFQE
eukprot:132997_1